LLPVTQPHTVTKPAASTVLTTVGAFQRAARGSGTFGGSFVSRLDANATQYLYQTFFGGSAGGASDNFDTVPQVALVTGNTVLVSGQTTAYDFPVTALAADPTSSNGNGSGNEGFVMRLALDADASGDLSAAAPALLSPPDGVTFRNGLVGRLEWGAVSDPAGLESYEFQLASRSDFHKDFLECRGAIAETEVLVPPSTGQSGGLSQITHFWRVRTVDRAGNLSAWSSTRSFTISSTAGQPSVSGVQVHPSSGVVGGGSATGMVHLYDPAPAGGLVAKLTVHHDRGSGLDRTRNVPLPASVPATVTIPAGAYSAPFAIATTAVSATTGVSIVATVNGVGNQGLVSVVPPSSPRPVEVALRPGSVTGGRPVTGTVTLERAAPAGGTLVSLLSSHPAAASLPATVTVPAGAKSVDFAVTTSAVPFEIDVGIGATSGGGGSGRSLYVRPPNLPLLTGMTLPASVAGGGQVNGTLAFSGPIPLGTWPGMQDAVVRFASSDPEAAAASPSDEFLIAGTTNHTFRVFTRAVPTARNVTITAYFDGVAMNRVLSVGAVTGITPSSMSANVTNLKGGHGGVGTVNLAAPVPVVGGVYLTLSTSHPQLFTSLPANVFLSSGSTSGSFAFVTSTTATAATPVTVTATYGASSANLALTINPPDSIFPPAVSVTLAPASVTGGSSSTGTVTLQGAAPPGGAVVQLFSGNSSVAGVPASVTVAAGASSASFPVTTTNPATTTAVSIGALLHLSPSTVLTVTSTAPPPTPGTPSLLAPANLATVSQPIAFDWSDASNAAMYEIQIDNASTFSAPLTLTQTVSVSQATIGGLPAQQLWWRVRGINSAGVAGPFSSSRRFTAQAPPAAASLSSVSVSPSSVVGGNGSTGTATLTSAAPAGGLVVTLSSSNATVASVPASVTVSAGATSATFAVTTTTVTSSTSVTITGIGGGTTRTTTLTVTPPGGGGPLPAPSLVSPSNDARFDPGQNITFDWSDVAGAASYTIQIDDSSSFPSPFVLQQTVTPSTFGTSTLPTRTMWWRVRANDSGGNPGNWSGSRRFEVKD